MVKNSWLKIVVTGNPRLGEPLSDFLVGILGAGVEMGAKGEPGYGVITAWLEDVNLRKEERESVLLQVREHLAVLEAALGAQESELSWELVEEQDWGACWKKHFAPFTIVPGLVIVPSWEEYTSSAGEQVLELDPGMAFGTGHHDTTSLSMEHLRGVLAGKKRRRLLDVGTGTGILGMAGVLFGADKVLGIDNDPAAVEVAVENVRNNGLSEKMEIQQTPLAQLDGKYDVVVANIIHDVLLSMKEDLVARVAPGGSLILSGILKGRQAKNIKSVFTELGLLLVEEKSGEEWVALCLLQEA